MTILNRFLRFASILALVAAVGLVGSCGGGGGGGSSSSTGVGSGGTGSAAVLLADGPAEDYDHLWMSVLEVTLLPQDGSGLDPVTLFRSSDPDGYEFDLLDERIRSLTFGTANYYSPAWSHDGSLLAFTCDRDGTQNLYVMQYDSTGNSGSGIRKVSNFTTAAFDPVWTEKGSLLFTTFDAYSFQIRGLNDVPLIRSV